MQRTVSAHIDLDIRGLTNMVFSLSAARGADVTSERFSFALDGTELEFAELPDLHGGRLQQFVSTKGRMAVDYTAEIEGRAAPVEPNELDLITYLRPSRYCQSDSLYPTARSEFAGLSGHNLLRAVTEWVWTRLSYVSGSSLPTDGATRTLLNRQGVCRDFAHVTIAMLRAMDVPARMVAVYAPGLSPMDFHAVVEAWVDGQWWVVDATRLAPRQSLLRISTGRDAADTAWLTSNWTDLAVLAMRVTVTADELPLDDHVSLVQLG
ncbi:transglutaminase superfamily protein [Glaciihabitans tibetensis]|uniref:Transglutaminase superfamily protein n=1 Tax=Glaciihabitans tibetensis TaxID=1266600 RepID=A0A2T0VH87_9MICO|nr:transglutaminase family protein [Glaciihabitans tibetensis]PRY69586.1 transglutaminase superfamily protein [Glaciihabitans tibetensis]